MEYDDIARIVYGHSQASFAGTDAILVTQIAEYVRSLPALGRIDKLAIQTIVMLADYNPILARQQATQLIAR